MLQRLGKDPAFGAGPLGTVIQDLLSIVIYFTAAAAILGSTLSVPANVREAILRVRSKEPHLTDCCVSLLGIALKYAVTSGICQPRARTRVVARYAPAKYSVNFMNSGSQRSGSM